MKIDFEKASFKDFENIPNMDIFERSSSFNDYLNYLEDRGHLNYRIENTRGCGPTLTLNTDWLPKEKGFVNFVSNDYLGFTQHPEVKKAAQKAIEIYGTGAGASPAIGGHFSYHQELEEKMARFFQKEAAILYTTGYTANSATLQCLMKKEDLAILDMAVHTSVFEGCLTTNVKTFLHNNLEHLEQVLKKAQSAYRTKMVVIDGVYSQNGDWAMLPEIVKLSHQYGAYVFLDDAHGTGVIGKTGRGLIEYYNLFKEVDFISGTFSKAFAGLGGYVVGNSDVVRFLKFQSRQHLFSATMPPATAASVSRSIDLLDEESFWMENLWKNIAFFKEGLISIGLEIGNTQSAIIPVKIGDPAVTGEVGKLLLKEGVYANSIIYPAVSKKDARIRMAVMATHSKSQLQHSLDAFEKIARILPIRKKQDR